MAMLIRVRKCCSDTAIAMRLSITAEPVSIEVV
jgi:hypothetical protein